MLVVYLLLSWRFLDITRIVKDESSIELARGGAVVPERLQIHKSLKADASTW